MKKKEYTQTAVEDKLVLNQLKSAESKLVKKSKTGDFFVVGLGASAGGLEALEKFFAEVPENCGMAFVVIQHLDPKHVGMMAEILQRKTTMTVTEASHNLKIRPNCVYVIPPNKSMSMLGGVLYLFEPVEAHGLRLPIDIFFRSLANDRKEKSVGVILSGMGSDGSLGIKAIKEKNGIVIVQAPATAKFDSMPRNAIESVIADIIEPVEDLPAKLIAFIKFIPEANTIPEINVKTLSNIDKIIILLREQLGHDFSGYKKSTLHRRIEKRQGLHQIDNMSNYVRFCQENPGELDVLFKELLIGVTNFFRDAVVWKMMKEQILPELISGLPNGYVIRVWVTACSTGEEAYSLAIIFKEVLENIPINKNLKLKIFATDIDLDSIELARKGVYPSNIAVDVSPERLDRFFTVDAEGYRIKNNIREMLVFAPHNLIKEPPFTRLDLLTCRNLLIYMEPELQKKLYKLFNYTLNPDGIMVLGSAENLDHQSSGFEILDSRLKIFKRTLATSMPVIADYSDALTNKTKVMDIQENIKSNPVENIRTYADQIILQRFAPACVLVKNNGDILYMSGKIGKYIEPVAGEANWNILTMARSELRQELTSAFRKAKLNFDPVVVSQVKLTGKGVPQLVNITIQSIEHDHSLKGMLMVVFTDVPEMVIQDLPDPKTGKRNQGGDQEKNLKIELQRKEEELQSLLEEMQVSQEELNLTNEELQSANEELQAANEELTTSKEEMQSMNEELQSVNFELKTSVGDYKLAGSDMENLLNSIEIATLFLDNDLNIRRFTNYATNVFRIRSADLGRPFTDISTDLLYPKIVEHSRQVLKTLIAVDHSISTHDGRWYAVRIIPYYTLGELIDGLVITFIDITVAKKLEIQLEAKAEEIKASEIQFRSLFELAKDGILMLDAETGMIVDVNPFLIELLGYSKDQFMEKSIWQIGFLKDIVANKDKFIELHQKELVRYENLPLETADGRRINVEFVSNVYLVGQKKVVQCFIREII
jgi:two-component system CheB/CheR fusion protein